MILSSSPLQGTQMDWLQSCGYRKDGDLSKKNGIPYSHRVCFVTDERVPPA
jgi:hypothetical protein